MGRLSFFKHNVPSIIYISKGTAQFDKARDNLIQTAVCEIEQLVNIPFCKWVTI